MLMLRITALLILVLLPSSLSADIIVTFEGFGDSTVISTEIPGLTFTNAIILTSGVSLNELEFPPRSGINVVSDLNGPLTIDFASPVLSVGGYFTYAVPLSMVAYDASLTSLGSISSLFNSNLASSGDPTSLPNEFLSLAFPTSISRITIQGDPTGGSFVMDDLTYSGTTTVPEPSSLWLLCTGLILMATIRYRRRFVSRRLRGILTVLLCVTGVFSVESAFAQSVSAPSISPDAITAGTPATVTISALVLSGAQPVIANGVTLLRIDSTGRATVVATLNDAGLNGDVLPSDSIFTTRLSMNEGTAAPVKFQVSAAFVGTLRRSLSPVVQLDVSQSGVPTSLRTANTADIVSDPLTGGLAVCNEVFLVFTSPASSGDISTVLSSVGGQIVGKLASIGVYQVQVPGCDSSSLNVALTTLRSNPLVASASPNAVGTLFGSYSPNDPYFLQEWGVVRIKAPSAWGIPIRRGATIGVIDSGVNANHEDLAGQVVLGLDQCGDQQGGSCVGDIDPNDENGHGTGVASIAAALADNGKGMAGVAFRSPVIAEKITYKQDASVDAGRAALAIVDAVMKGARVLNLSFGVNDSNGAVQRAINYALERNRVVIAAAGNSNTSGQAYPAAYPGVISVGASDENNQRAVWSTNIGGPCPGLLPNQASNYGAWVDIYAPGTNIFVAKKTDTSGYETVCAGGTSFAAPFVTGTVALMLTANKNLTPAQVKGILKSTGQHTGNHDVQNGREIVVVDASAAADGAFSAAITPYEWQQTTVAPAPQGRLGHVMAYDNSRREVVLFGGYTYVGQNTVLLNDTWVWNGVNWVQKFPSTSPPAVGYSWAMAYDASRQQIVLFGNGNQTWIWNGATWTQRFPVTSPPPRSYHSGGMVYDSARQQVVLFGGFGFSDWLADTWVWDGTNWRQKSPAISPGKRCFHAMGYDQARQQVVLFGGVINDFNGYYYWTDTWIWDGNSWIQMNPPHSPPFLYGGAGPVGALAFDAKRGNLVGTNANETWVWNGTTWLTATGVTNPPSGFGPVRQSFGMAFDGARSQFVLFGGYAFPPLGDTWLTIP